MHNEMLYDLCDLLSEATEEVVGQVRKAGNKMNATQLDQIDKLTHAMKSVKTTLAMIESEEGSYGEGYGNYGRRDSRGRYMSNGYSRPYMADQPDRRPPNNYGSGNGSNLVNELNRIMAQETNQRKLEMYQQMLDLAQRV